MQALHRYPKCKRSAVARLWASRSHAVQAAARLTREPDPETVRRRTLDDRRGRTFREGHTYHGDGQVTAWRIVHSVAGRTDQFDIIVSGWLWRTGGKRIIARYPGATLSACPKTA
jgi:hypothetical protein